LQRSTPESSPPYAIHARPQLLQPQPALIRPTSQVPLHLVRVTVQNRHHHHHRHKDDRRLLLPARAGTHASVPPLTQTFSRIYSRTSALSASRSPHRRLDQLSASSPKIRHVIPVGLSLHLAPSAISRATRRFPCAARAQAATTTSSRRLAARQGTRTRPRTGSGSG
jgi:hypothetical protein